MLSLKQTHGSTAFSMAMMQQQQQLRQQQQQLVQQEKPHQPPLRTATTGSSLHQYGNTPTASSLSGPSGTAVYADMSSPYYRPGNRLGQHGHTSYSGSSVKALPGHQSSVSIQTHTRTDTQTHTTHIHTHALRQSQEGKTWFEEFKNVHVVTMEKAICVTMCFSMTMSSLIKVVASILWLHLHVAPVFSQVVKCGLQVQHFFVWTQKSFHGTFFWQTEQQTNENTWSCLTKGWSREDHRKPDHCRRRQCLGFLSAPCPNLSSGQMPAV